MNLPSELLETFVDELADALAARLEGAFRAHAHENLAEPWRLLTLAETAERLSRSEKTVRRWVREGRLPRVHLDGGAWAFDPDDLRDFTRARRVGGPDSLAAPLAGARNGVDRRLP